MIYRQESATEVLALHGFTLGGAMFAELADLLDVALVAPDLPGHGGRDAGNTTWDAAVDEVVALVEDIDPAAVVGYSMGGRLALAAALRSPELFRTLILVSTSVGIVDESARAERRRNDAAMAAAIESSGSADEFVLEFGQTPFLQAPNTSLDLESMRLANTPEGIVGALRGMGQGCQPYFGSEIAALAMPINWIAGSLDQKYLAIAEEAAATCANGSVVKVEANHNVVAERPAAVAAVIEAAIERSG